MTAGTTPGLDQEPTTYQPLVAWVRQVAELTTPDQVVWCDGSDQEWQTLTGKLVETGTLVRLREKPNSFWCATDPEDAAPLEERTFVCCKDEADAGPTNNWMDPLDMKIVMTEHYRGCMAGRTLYVIPYCLGPLTAGKPMLGVELTDSPYVVVSMGIMTRMGRDALALFGSDTDPGTGFMRGLHSVGAPLKPGQQDVPWPCDRTTYLTHFPEERMIWSYGSGHGANATLGKSHALRIASVIAREEGWLAEHMLILKLTTPTGTTHYLAAAFPSGCGATTLAMLEPGIPGWTVETLGDDIAWLRFGADGRLYAINPETGIDGRAPGTGWQTNPNAMRTLSRGNSIFTNVALTDDGDVWWEGYSQAPPDHLTTWKRERWTLAGDLASGKPTAHTNARYYTPISQCPSTAPEWQHPHGVPISAILFGSRRASTIPLVVESRDWQHGVFLGATVSTTADEVVHRDPMAMRPFLGYHAGDYLQHWIGAGTHADPAMLPKIFSVNWFRRGADGHLLWPGFSENSRVLQWIIERVEDTTAAVDTPIGSIPTTNALRQDGLDTQRRDIEAALTVDLGEWRTELPLIEQWFATIGDKLPAALHNELETLKHRLA